MSNILLLLQRVHQNVHQNRHSLDKKKFSVPKIYTGGVDITLWNELSKEEHKQALSKDWYIYYKFIDTTTGKLKRMPNIKGGSNRYKTKRERLLMLTQLRDALEYLLEKGLNPYIDSDTSLLEFKKITPRENKKVVVAPISNDSNVAVIPEPVKAEIIEPVLSIKEAFAYALKIKKKSLNDTSYMNFEGRINRFKKSIR